MCTVGGKLLFVVTHVYRGGQAAICCDPCVPWGANSCLTSVAPHNMNVQNKTVFIVYLACELLCLVHQLNVHSVHLHVQLISVT